MAEWSLIVAGILLGAGLGLLLLDFKKTRTTVTETTATGEITHLGTGQLLKESLGLVKDLTPGKTLLVLGVALLGVSLVAVTPPDGSEVTVQTVASARR